MGGIHVTLQLWPTLGHLFQHSHMNCNEKKLLMENPVQKRNTSAS